MSGVDQMKIPGNAAQSAEGRNNIPWSQQVDEASHENLSSPIIDENTGVNTMQFQYPPFNAKELSNSVSGNLSKSQKPSSIYDHKYESRSSKTSNIDLHRKFEKPGISNETKREDHQANIWGSRRSGAPESIPGNFMKSNKNEGVCTSNKIDNKPREVIERSSVATSTLAPPKKTTWASIASQPAKLTLRTTFAPSGHKKKGPGMPPPPMVPGKHNLDVNAWDLPNNNPPLMPSPPPPIDLSYSAIISDHGNNPVLQPSLNQRPDKGNKNLESAQKKDNETVFTSNSNFCRSKSSTNGSIRKICPSQNPNSHQHKLPSNTSTSSSSGSFARKNESGPLINRQTERRGHFSDTRNDYDGNAKIPGSDENSVDKTNLTVSVNPQALLDELRDKNNYNPYVIDLDRAKAARFFVIKSYSEDDIHRSIKYEIWCSTDHGNKRLDDAFKERHKEGGNVLLFFSVNGSGHFCGMAQMMTAVDYNSISSVWSQDKWKGKFKVKWIYVKDVPNINLRHIRLENNDHKSVTKSRDTQEVPRAKGIEVLQILHSFKHSTSIFDDFSHYEKKQEEEVSSKRPLPMYCNFDGLGNQQMQNFGNKYISRHNDDNEKGERDRDRDSRDNRGINSGSNSQKNFNNYRDRNLIFRSGALQNNYNDQRRNVDNQRINSGDYHLSEKESIDQDRENEYRGRHTSKYDHSRRDDHIYSKLKNNRLRDLSTEQNKNDYRFRVGLTAQMNLPKVSKDSEKTCVQDTEH